MSTIAEALRDAIAILGSEHRIDAEILLSHVLVKPRAYLYAWPDKSLLPAVIQKFDALIEQRLQGIPIAYLIGNKEFWSLPLTITKDVLIPRPETELLVETVLNTLPEHTPQKIADIGTGSGAIALALAHARPDWQITAVDISNAALQCAAENAKHLKLSIEFLLGNYCEPIANHFNAIVSNPPYIAIDDPHLAQGDVRFEPELALMAAENGLAAFKAIATQAKNHLQPNGFLFFEHGYQQKDAVQIILCENGYGEIKTLLDLAGHPRVTLGQLIHN